jgi:hypothetical protein
MNWRLLYDCFLLVTMLGFFGARLALMRLQPEKTLHHGLWAIFNLLFATFILYNLVAVP